MNESEIHLKMLKYEKLHWLMVKGHNHELDYMGI